MASAPEITAKSVKRKWIKRLSWTIGIFVIVAFLGCTGLSAYVGWNLTHPARYLPTNFPESVGLLYENVRFESSDGLKLKGWLIPASVPSKKLIIFAHGYSNNRSYEVASLPTVKALHDAGYSCLMFDFRNSGYSEGKLTSIGQFEKLDLLAAVAYGKTHGYEQFGIVGYSMGASTAALAAAESSDIQAIVMDSAFAALRPYLEANLSVWSHLPDFPFTPLVLWVTPSLIGVDAEQVRPIDVMDDLRGKGILLIHAKHDNRIPASNSEQLYAAAGASYAELYETDTTKHVGSYEVDPQTYIQKVVDLFNRYLN